MSQATAFIAMRIISSDDYWIGAQGRDWMCGGWVRPAQGNLRKGVKHPRLHIMGSGKKTLGGPLVRREGQRGGGGHSKARQWVEESRHQKKKTPTMVDKKVRKRTSD